MTRPRALARQERDDRDRWARLAVLCWLRGQITYDCAKKYLVKDLGMTEDEAVRAMVMCEP